MDDDDGVGLGLGSAIFVAPLIFGWLVFREGYGTVTRIVVAVYMLISAFLLYYLISILWTSGDQVKTLAQDFERNREVAARNVDTAKDYMGDYEAGDLGAAEAQPPAAARREVVRIESVALARALEAGRGSLTQFDGKDIAITGAAIAPAQGSQLYLQGTDNYPAVTLHFDQAAPQAQAGTSVQATCARLTIATAGPNLTGCR